MDFQRLVSFYYGLDYTIVRATMVHGGIFSGVLWWTD